MVWIRSRSNTNGIGNGRTGGDELLLRHSTSAFGGGVGASRSSSYGYGYGGGGGVSGGGGVGSSTVGPGGIQTSVAAAKTTAAELERFYHGGASSGGLAISMSRSRSFGRERVHQTMMTRQQENPQHHDRNNNNPVIELHHGPLPTTSGPPPYQPPEQDDNHDRRSNLRRSRSSGGGGGGMKPTSRRSWFTTNNSNNHHGTESRNDGNDNGILLNERLNSLERRSGAVPASSLSSSIEVGRAAATARANATRGGIRGKAAAAMTTTKTTKTTKTADLNDRIERIERALFESEQQQQAVHTAAGVGATSATKLHHQSRHRIDLIHNPNFPQGGRSSLAHTPERSGLTTPNTTTGTKKKTPAKTNNQHHHGHSSDHYKQEQDYHSGGPAVSSSSPSPTLFATTKQMISREEESWPLRPGTPKKKNKSSKHNNKKAVVVVVVDEDEGSSSSSLSGNDGDQKGGNGMTTRQWKQLKKSSRDREEQQQDQKTPRTNDDDESSKKKKKQGKSISGFFSARSTPTQPPKLTTGSSRTPSAIVTPTAVRVQPNDRSSKGSTPSPIQQQQSQQQQSTPRASNVASNSNNSNNNEGNNTENNKKDFVDPVEQFRSTLQNEDEKEPGEVVKQDTSIGLDVDIATAKMAAAAKKDGNDIDQQLEAALANTTLSTGRRSLVANLHHVLSDLSTSTGMDDDDTEVGSAIIPRRNLVIPHPTMACMFPTNNHGDAATAGRRQGEEGLCVPLAARLIGDTKINCHSATLGQQMFERTMSDHSTIHSSVKAGAVPKEVVTRTFVSLSDTNDDEENSIVDTANDDTEEEEDDDVGINKNTEGVGSTATAVNSTAKRVPDSATTPRKNISLENDRQQVMAAETRHPLHNKSPISSPVTVEGQDENDDRYPTHGTDGDSFDEAALERLQSTARSHASTPLTSNHSTGHRRNTSPSSMKVYGRSGFVERTQNRSVPRVNPGVASPGKYSSNRAEVHSSLDRKHTTMAEAVAKTKRQAMQPNSKSRSAYQHNVAPSQARPARSPRGVLFHKPKNGRELDYMVERGGNLLQNTHPTIADEARRDAMHVLGSSASSSRKIQDLKLSPYHPKTSPRFPDRSKESNGRKGWFGRKKKDKNTDYTEAIALIEQAQQILLKQEEEKNRQAEHHNTTLHATGSSVESGITTEEGDATSHTPDERVHPVLIFERNRDQQKPAEDVAAQQGCQSVSSEQPSVNSTSHASESVETHPSTNLGGHHPGGGNLHHNTTFDDIIQDLQRFEEQLPHAEFAVVELGEDSDTIPTHSILMNKEDVEHELTSPRDDDENLAIMSTNHTFMPYGLEPISEDMIEEHARLANVSPRAIDDMSMERMNASDSFADQINHLRQIQAREKELAAARKKDKKHNKKHRNTFKVTRG